MTAAAPCEALAAAALALARSFHRGATLWCWSPALPSHGRHLAVEFVHPVIVGKRALPALAVGPGHAVEDLRRSVRPGDVLAVVGRGDDAEILDVARRAPAWGLDVLWLATGESPGGDTGARVVGLGPDADDADVVCAYHLLWELAHVCFEHPGVLDVPPDDPSSCPACADAGDVGEVERPGVHDATVLIEGVARSVDLTLVGPCDVGDLVVVHAGVAITKLVGAGRG